MAKDLVMPKLGAEMTAGKIAEWKKKEGELVNKGEILVVIETDKITYELESPETGYLHIMKGTDEEIPVAGIIAIFCASPEEIQSLAGQKPQEAAPAGPPPPAKPAAVTAATAPAVLPVGPPARRDIRISPLARKLAKEYNLDITQIQGKGPGGRIEKQDVQSAFEMSQKGLQPPPAEKAADIIVPPVSSAKTAKQIIPVRGMRKVIAQRLHGSLQQMAQFTDLGEIDVTETVRFRQQLVEKADIIGVKISYNDLLLKMVAIVLQEMPIMNASIIGEEIHLWNEINIGVAVSLEDGLVVPVVRNAARKSLVEIHRELEDLITRARSRKLAPDEISGGTFTLSNVGSFGSLYGTVIINPPEVAILGIGLIRQIPAVVNGEIAIRWSLSYGLTMDHRAMDGAVGGDFLQRLRRLCEHPYLLNVL